ncbi:MAG: kelch repeat-containing protein [Bacteroidia bacterium]
MKKLFLFSFFILIATTQVPAQLGFWTLRDTFPGDERSASMAFNVGTGAYVSCGIDSTGYKRSTYLFNPATNTWTQLQSLGGVTGSGLGRDIAMSFVVGNNAYVVGGQGSIAYFNDTWKYDAFNDMWTQVQNFGGGGRRSGIGFAINSKGYVACGQSSTGLKNDLWEYNPATNTWIQKANYSGTARRLPVVFVIGGSAFVGTGDDGICKGDFFAYDPVANTWTTKAALTGTPRYGAVGFTLNGKGYVGFGYDNTLSNRKDFFEYDPVSNSWVQMANFPGTARANAVAVACPNGRAYMGTGYDSLFRNDWWEFDPLSNGVNENQLNENSVNIYPNPMLTAATLSVDNSLFNNNDKLIVFVFDLNGKMLRKLEMKNTNVLQIEREELASGIYLVHIVSAMHGAVTKRLIVE